MRKECWLQHNWPLISYLQRLHQTPLFGRGFISLDTFFKKQPFQPWWPCPWRLKLSLCNLSASQCAAGGDGLWAGPCCLHWPGPGPPGPSLGYLHGCQQCHLPALAGCGEVRCTLKEESWDAERLAGRVPHFFPPVLATTIRSWYLPRYAAGSSSTWTSCWLAGRCRKHGEGRSRFGNKPRRRTINILILSALFPRAFPSTFLTPFGTFVLLRWCHLPKLSPWSLSSWSAGRLAEPGHACLHFVLCPDTPAGTGCPSHPAHATLLPLGILGSEFFSLYLYLDQVFNSTTIGSVHFQIKLWFQFPIPIYSVLELAEQSYTYVLLRCVHCTFVSQPQLTC